MGKDAIRSEDAAGTEETRADELAEGGRETPAGAAARPDDEGLEQAAAEDAGVTDSHGQPGIARGKYEREMRAKDERIAELEAKLDEQAKTASGREDLKREIDGLRSEIAEERTSHALEMAGCRNAKAAKALLGDFDGDVAKLKEACPYLFEEERRAGSTGLRPEGAAHDIDERLDRAFGIKRKE